MSGKDEPTAVELLEKFHELRVELAGLGPEVRELSRNMKKIVDALYDPKDGIYATLQSIKGRAEERKLSLKARVALAVAVVSSLGAVAAGVLPKFL